LSIVYRPLAFFHSSHKETYEAPRQSVLAENAKGWFELDKDYGVEALEDLKGFERVWLLYDFHNNKSWKAKVRPPRFSKLKRSVFSTRSPYRPNSIGLSCVKLEKIEGRRVFVSGHDILEGSPILDIKPYIPYADAFPESKTGWLKPDPGYEVLIEVLEQVEWLEKKLGLSFKQILSNQLAYEPTHSKAKRVKKTEEAYVFAIRTWRFLFQVEGSRVRIFKVLSGYTREDLVDAKDPYSDKEIHRLFLETFRE